MIRLIGLDLDGTLLTRDKRITQRTQIMLEEASRIGVHIVPVTGRPLSGIPRQVTDFPFIRYAITSNGAVVTDRKTGRTIRKRVFMGDTGSLALGGFVTAVAYLTRFPLFIPIVGFIYFIEVVSVIIQVGYFKKTHGKRIFRMAPIHHHFELGGWSEVKVVAVFTVTTAVLSAIALLGIWN